MALTKKEASTKQENSVAKYLGWSVVKGSGSRPLYPGDLVSSNWLAECKTHVSEGHKIKFDVNVWSKIGMEAMSRMKFPALIVDDGSQNIEKTWVMFSGPSLAEKAIVFDYPYPVRSNVIFDGSALSRRHVKNVDDGISLVYSAYLNGKVVYICTLEYFALMFGEIF